MTERYGFSFGEDDPASRRGPGVTGQRGDEPPSSPQRADVREIDLTEDDEDDEDEEEVGPVGTATVDISPPPDEIDEDEDEDEEPSAGTTLAPATPLPRSDEAAAAQVEGGEPEAPSAGTAVASADATPAPRSGALLATDAEAVRRQFLDIQAGFVDEPRQAVEQAGELVEALHQKVLESLHAEREQLDDALAGEEPSTEDLRVALRAYRAYVDRLLGLHL